MSAPPDPTAIESRVRAALDAAGVPYEVLPCDPAAADTAAFCARYGIPPERSANAILVASKKPPGRYALCLLLATNRLDGNRTVRKKLDVSQVSFAPAEETEARTGMMLGGVTPFGLPAGLPVWVDPRVMACDWIVIGGGSRSMKVKLSPRALEKVPGLEVVPDLAKA
ncbi:MAG: hypothetical protein L0216_07195 [Planctomycetales bacterium]|nr:hypothetical protein [Planctomycetales bacterium]